MKTFLIVATLLVFQMSFGQKKWSLDDCIAHAKEHNIDIIKQRLENQKVSEDITIAKGDYFPSVNFAGLQGYNLGSSFNISTGVGQQESRFNTFSLSTSLDLFNGFKKKHQLQLAKLGAEKGAVELDRIGLDISLNIANQYLQVLFNKEIMAVAGEQQQISGEELTRLNALFEAALASRSEVLEMKATASLDTKEFVIAQNNLLNSLIELKTLLDIQNIENFDIETIPIASFSEQINTPNAQIIYENALTINPQLKATRLASDMSEKNIKIAKAAFYPNINFGYTYSTNYYHIQGTEDVILNSQTGEFENNDFITQLDNNRIHFLGVTATVPIFNRFLTKSNVDKAKVDMEISKVELENQQKELRNKIEIAYNDLVTARASLDASQVAYTAQKDAFEIARAKYLEGLITSYEFLESKSKYIQTQSERIQARYDYLFKIKVLEYYQ